MKDGFIKASWLLLAKTLQLQPGSIQCIEMEKAYFAGAYTIMKSVKTIGDKVLDDHAAAGILDAIWQECEAFRISQQFDPEHN